MVTLDNLNHIAPKGQGYFCLVKLYIDESTGDKYALKELKKKHYPNDEYRYRLNREISLLSKLQDCDNIVQLITHGNDEKAEKLWYLMPFADCNLLEYIRKNSSKLALEDKFSIAGQIIAWIKFAHQRNILHRDISPNNVLIFNDNGLPSIKITDFGLGKDTKSLSFYTNSDASGYGQILYVAPEQRQKLKDSTTRSDIYSLGKLIYFIFTGKDPDNLKPFELSTLVTKATEDNPENRFANIVEFEEHFNALRELLLNKNIPIGQITLKEALLSGEEISTLKLHQLLVMGNYIDHVYDDYLSAANSFLLTDNNLYSYYHSIGESIREFVETYCERLNYCYQSVRWPFSAMNTFGKLLKKIIQIVTDDSARLLCFKQLWYLAFEADQWNVQKDIKEVFTSQYISKNIESQLAEHITANAVEVDLSKLPSTTMPKVIKMAVLTGNAIANKRAIDRAQEEKALWGEID